MHRFHPACLPCLDLDDTPLGEIIRGQLKPDPCIRFDLAVKAA